MQWDRWADGHRRLTDRLRGLARGCRSCEGLQKLRHHGIRALHNTEPAQLSYSSTHMDAYLVCGVPCRCMNSPSERDHVHSPQQRALLHCQASAGPHNPTEHETTVLLTRLNGYTSTSWAI